LDSLIFNSDDTVTSILSDDCDLSILVSWLNLNTISILEANLSGLVIIDDGNSGSAILTLKLSIGVRIIKLNEEILIGLPVIVIIDGDLNKGSCLSIFENDRFVNFFLIITGFSFSIDGSDVDSTCCSFLVQNVNSN
jgi:hypothetical protein